MVMDQRRGAEATGRATTTASEHPPLVPSFSTFSREGSTPQIPETRGLAYVSATKGVAVNTTSKDPLGAISTTPVGVHARLVAASMLHVMAPVTPLT